jgi:uncharacterized protein YkwD
MSKQIHCAVIASGNGVGGNLGHLCAIKLFRFVLALAVGLLVLAPISSAVARDAQAQGSNAEQDKFSSEKHRSYARGAYLPPAPRADSSALDGAYIDSDPVRSDRKANQSSLTRAQVVDLYNTLYVPGNGAAVGWTGSGWPSCAPGTTSTAYRQHMLNRINFFRRIAGLPPIAFFAASDFAGQAAQASALMQGVNNDLDHSPPSGWLCYSATGATGAGKSNLGLGYSGTSVVDGYMDDNGVGNEPVGHRRWLLYPPFAKGFSGDVTGGGVASANSLWVIPNGSDGTWGSRPAMPNGVAWPPGGFIPYQALPDISNRWSFSWPGANMSAATVSITKNGQPVAIIAYDSRDDFGYGDASVVFRPNRNSASGPFISYSSPGAADQPYVVTVSGMTGGGVPSSVTYTVTVIDPAVSPSIAISGNATQSPSGNVDGATICASPSAGVSCGSVNAGAYSCTVPNGWTGTLHLQAGNAKRAAARRFTTAVTSAQVNQHFVATDANNATLTCNLDIDNNGLYEAQFDGAMILRKLFGFAGNEQAVAGSGVCAQRTSVSDKATFLGAQNFDVNDNGALGATASLDGLVLVRLMLGVPGATAVAGTGLTWANVQSELNAKCGTNF